MGGWLMMLVFWALVVVGIVALIRFATGGAARRGGVETPLEILRRRYVTGELTKEQFEQMKRDVA
jgi:putative membrane protein